MVLKILIVEDNPTDRELLLYILAERFQKEAKFREANTLEMAISYLERGDIDCIVLDLALPDSVGKETFQRLYKDYSYLPIVVMTHNKDRDTALNMIKEGASDYILKDFTNEEDIFRRIVYAIEKHKNTVRVSTESAKSIKKLDSMRVKMMNAHESGEYAAVQMHSVETTAAIAETTKNVFTAMQELNIKFAKTAAKMEHMSEVVDDLKKEIHGAGGRSSMRSHLDLLDHRMLQAEERINKNIDEEKDAENTQKIAAAQIHSTAMSNKTKIIVTIITVIGTIVAAFFAYKASTSKKDIINKGSESVMQGL